MLSVDCGVGRTEILVVVVISVGAIFECWCLMGYKVRSPIEMASLQGLDWFLSALSEAF